MKMSNWEVHRQFERFQADLLRHGASPRDVAEQALTLGVGAAMGSGADSGSVLRLVRDLVDQSVEYMQSDEYRNACKVRDDEREMVRCNVNDDDRSKLS
jgi:hypothetical protein